MVSSPSSPPTAKSDRASDLAECGWRTVIAHQPDGTTTYDKVPLTPEEFLHPQEDYHLPNSTFHDDIAGQAKDILTRRYANDPTTGVFRDLLIQPSTSLRLKWDIPGQKDLCPDTFVAFGIRHKEQNRSNCRAECGVYAVAKVGGWEAVRVAFSTFQSSSPVEYN